MTDANKNRQLLAVIGDEDTITGMLLAGIGQVDDASHSKNFFVVDGKTTDEQLEKAFETYTNDRDDIAILLINQHLAERIRFSVDNFTNAFPAVLEIPSKEHPYDPEKDSVLRRVRRLFGE
ncbi:CYFA0S10e01992g1_1 [Cyberlindnera fabianii]|uniref:V-type proton ATPase subunit F n=1 Tax=Cyberlindnera fabianii TaxID=36022 RepID=A0A061B508_CYBFA|nr:V-type proton ATPase subunit F [Cyberlindnera fabianii]CDR42765.1 CYFA0S10e01992g1_1 [Cyberlindnera fabianii]